MERMESRESMSKQETPQATHGDVASLRVAR
jgi:hypothetical protein